MKSAEAVKCDARAALERVHRCGRAAQSARNTTSARAAHGKTLNRIDHEPLRIGRRGNETTRKCRDPRVFSASSSSFFPLPRGEEHANDLNTFPRSEARRSRRVHRGLPGRTYTESSTRTNLHCWRRCPRHPHGTSSCNSLPGSSKNRERECAGKKITVLTLRRQEENWNFYRTFSRWAVFPAWPRESSRPDARVVRPTVKLGNMGNPPRTWEEWA